MVIIDPALAWTGSAARMQSKSKNTLFEGWAVMGKVTRTFVAGREVLTMVEGTAAEARYDAEVFTDQHTGRARVLIRRDGAALDGDAVDIAEAHVAQLLALAKALGKREDAPWPRGINRWRSPGVR